MKKALVRLLTLLVLTLLANPLRADIQGLRWTHTQETNASLENVIAKINQQLGLRLTKQDFLLLEDRSLATSQFKMYVQTTAGIPIRFASIRTWEDLESKKAIQIEAFVETKSPIEGDTLKKESAEALVGTLVPNLLTKDVLALIRKIVKSDAYDNQVRSIKSNEFWENGVLVRIIEVRGRRGVHEFTVDLANLKVIKHVYNEFPQVDQEFSVPAKVYPIYEETAVDRISQNLIEAELKYIKSHVPLVKENSYSALRSRRYFDESYSSLLGLLPIGQANGYWSSTVVREKGLSILESLPKVANSFENGVILTGRYATVSLHPDAIKKFTNLNFKPEINGPLRFDWIETNLGGNPTYEMIPRMGFTGKKLNSATDALSRPATRDPNHNPELYINEGFDEVQVYYAVTKLFESLREMGFTDPELSTRPFNAFLYDPDISMKDNAYYTEDTINFTTYSGNQPNYARDNPTIWHELGHGIMDRLMGDQIRLADTGGLSEGMADFLAFLVTADVSNGESFDGLDEFRIINRIGFNLTNEVHDDGEAYGGAMKDLLDAAMLKEGKLGLHKVTDLTLEAMRLARNHPGLTANGWFGMMLYADELGRKGLRQSGEMRDLILSALNGRNFSFTDTSVASFSLQHKGQEVDPRTPGSRQSPIKVNLAANAVANFPLVISLKDSDVYKFEYPVTVELQLEKGPLQGAIDWKDEEIVKRFKIEKPGDSLPISLQIKGTCDEVNRDDGSCVDFAYIHIFSASNSKKPVAKKRFYLSLKTQDKTEQRLGKQ